MSKVTLGIATWSNSKKYLNETLESLANQTFKDNKIIIDDNETKNVWDKWSDFFKNCETDFIALPAADDVYEPRWLELSITFLNDHPDCYAVASMDTQIDENSKRIETNNTNKMQAGIQNTFDFTELFNNMWKFGTFIRFPSIVYRASAVKDFSFVVDEKIGGASDCYSYYQMLAKGYKIGLMSDQLYKSRIHDKQYSQAQRNNSNPIDHWEAIDEATKLMPNIRTMEIDLQLKNFLKLNQLRRDLKKRLADKKTPLVTVQICDYEGGRRFRQEMIDCLNAQTFEDYKLVSDRAETDHAIDRWNKAIDECDTEYFILFHHDDLYDDDFLEQMVNHMNENPDIAFASCFDTNIDENGNRLTGGAYLPIPPKRVYTFEDIFYAYLKEGSFIRHQTVILRPRMLDKTMRYNKEVWPAADTLLWFTILNKHPMGILNKKLSKSRIHSGQLTESQRTADGPEMHFESMNRASFLRKEIRTWSVVALLTRFLNRNEKLAEEKRLKIKLTASKKTRLVVVHEPPVNGTGILAADRVTTLNKVDDEWFTYYVMPNTSKDACAILGDTVNGIPIVAAPPNMLKTVIERYKADEVQVFHYLRWDDDQISFIFENSEKYNVSLWLHDSSWICGQWHLINDKNKICSGPAIDKCPNCLNIPAQEVMSTFRGMREIISKCSSIYANSTFIKNVYEKFLGRTDIKVHTYELPVLKKQLFKHKVGFFQSQYPVKGFHILLSAAQKLPDVLFILFCDVDKSLTDGRKLLGSDNVLIMGKYNRDELPLLVNTVDLGICPSLMESYGLVSRELPMLGLDVIATKTGGQEGTIEPDNVDALVEAIQEKLK